MKTKEKKNKYLRYLLIFIISIIVAPLTSFAKDEKVEEDNPIVLKFPNKDLTSFDGLSFDYWYMGSEPASLTDIDSKISLASEFDKKSKDELDKKFGKSLKSSQTLKEYYDLSTLKLYGLKDGYYLFKLDDESYDKLKTYTVPAFILKVDRIHDELYPKIAVPGISLNKVDEDDKTIFLEGVVFNLYEEGSDRPLKLIKEASGIYRIDKLNLSESKNELVTGKDGRIDVFGVDESKKYYFKEIKAKDGYQLKEEKSELVSSGKTLTITNKKIPPEGGRFKFVKVDASNHKKRLAGAEFLVLEENPQTGEYIEMKDESSKEYSKYILKSDENGEFMTKVLPNGSYRLKEIKAPLGYQRSLAYIDFEINDKKSSGKIEVKEIENVKIPPSEKPPTTPPTNPPPKSIVRSPIVKTGDIKIFIFLIAGLAFISFGVSLFKKDKKVNL